MSVRQVLPFSSATHSLDDARPLYFLPRDNLAEEVLIPGFNEASTAACMIGFFSSAALADLAPGLATYIQNSESSFRMIVSPFLTDNDQSAIEAGLKKPEELAADILETGFVSADDLQKHTLKCLSYLLSKGRIEIKIALMKNALFHPKVWLFETQAGLVAVHGSGNATRSGIRKNKEQITVSKSWMDPTQKYISDKFSDEFEMLWRNQDEDCLIVSLPDAVKQKLLRDYPADRQPTEDDFISLYKKAAKEPKEEFSQSDIVVKQRAIFAIPEWLKYEEGDYAHQGHAVQAWKNEGFRGTLEMATGSGKTLTSMIGAYKLYETKKPLLIIVAAPYVPLIQQWCGEISLFGLEPVNLTVAGNAAQRSKVLQGLRRKLRLGISDVEAIVVSHDTLCTPEFAEEIKTFECGRLLIADEAHNLGRSQFIDNPPDFIEYRLALSATPVRQYDPEGTDAVFAFFGPVVYQFTLKDAIGKCLVEYDYFINPVTLTQTEMDEWSELTARIRQNGWRQSEGKPDDYLAKLFRDRRALLETAHGKLDVLSKLLNKEDVRKLKHTLIYTSDKAPEQLQAVNNLLNKKGILFHQLTAEETSDRQQTMKIIEAFQRGDIQVLTAKRVLDEGVNIPQITKAYILASTTVERQWVQRRGRVLRICKDIDKTFSVIHDFLALPPIGDADMDSDAKDLVKSELRRAQEFASLARNAGKPGGPLEVIHPLIKAAMM